MAHILPSSFAPTSADRPARFRPSGVRPWWRVGIAYCRAVSLGGTAQQKSKTEHSAAQPPVRCKAPRAVGLKPVDARDASEICSSCFPHLASRASGGWARYRRMQHVAMQECSRRILRQRNNQQDVVGRLTRLRQCGGAAVKLPTASGALRNKTKNSRVHSTSQRTNESLAAAEVDQQHTPSVYMHIHRRPLTPRATDQPLCNWAPQLGSYERLNADSTAGRRLSEDDSRRSSAGGRRVLVAGSGTAVQLYRGDRHRQAGAREGISIVCTVQGYFSRSSRASEGLPCTHPSSLSRSMPSAAPAGPTSDKQHSFPPSTLPRFSELQCRSRVRAAGAPALRARLRLVR
jgi:hypothetical protein